VALPAQDLEDPLGGDVGIGFEQPRDLCADAIKLGGAGAHGRGRKRRVRRLSPLVLFGQDPPHGVAAHV
jgi:hypothetical protein